MRNIIFLSVLVAMSLQAKSQAIDSTAYKIARLEKIVGYMWDQLERSNGPFVLGMAFEIIGTGALASSALINDGATRNIVAIGGIAISITGLGLIISSHTQIARAGKWRWYGDRITVDF